MSIFSETNKHISPSLNPCLPLLLTDSYSHFYWQISMRAEMQFCKFWKSLKESEGNLFEYQSIFKDGNSPATLGYDNTYSTCDLRHCCDRIVTGTHTFGKGDITGIDSDIPALSPYIATAVNNKCTVKLSKFLDVLLYVLISDHA